MPSPIASGPATPPQVPGTLLLGNFSEVIRDPVKFFTELPERHGPAARLRFGPMHAQFYASPEAAYEILVRNAANYRKGMDYDFLALILGQGLVTSDGELWKRQRKLTQPAFHKQRIAGFGDLMARRARQVIAAWPAAPSTFDLHAEMMKLTLLIVAEALFSTDVSALADELGQVLGEALVVLAATARSVSGAFPLWLPLPRNRQLLRLRSRLYAIVDELIAGRRRARAGRPASAGSEGDLLELLLDARDEAGAPMSDRQLRDEVLTTLLAGHETTANTLTWALALLSQNPPVRLSLEEELDGVLQGRAPTLADLASLRLTSRVVDEALRLYPPSWILSRRALREQTILGYRVPKGENVTVSQLVIHRSPALWENPLRFDPDRFLPERSVGRPRLAFLPFGAGPRQCIGNQFALLEANLALATIAQSKRVDLVPGQALDLDPAITLRPKGRVEVTAPPRPGRST